MTKSQSRSARESCFSALVVGSGRAAAGYARWIRFSTLAVIFCRSLSEPLLSSRFSCSSRGWRFAYWLTTTMAEIWSRTASAMPTHTTAWNSSGGRWAQSRNSRSLPQRTAAMPSRHCRGRLTICVFHVALSFPLCGFFAAVASISCKESGMRFFCTRKMWYTVSYAEKLGPVRPVDGAKEDPFY